jgi:hypothetical protein
LHIIYSNMQTGKRRSGRVERESTRDQMANAISVAWTAGLLDQEEACLALGLNQGHFSKIVRGQFVRPSGRAAQVFEYAKRRLEAAGGSPNPQAGALPSRLTQAVWGAWDGTPEGERALEAILSGLREIRALARRKL